MNNNLFKKEIPVKQNIYVIFIYFSISDFTSYTQVNMRPFRGRDVQKWLRVAMLSPKDIVPSVPMGRKMEAEVNVKKFEFTTKTKEMNSEKLKELRVGREWFNKENGEGMGYAEFGKVLSAVHYYRL